MWSGEESDGVNSKKLGCNYFTKHPTICHPSSSESPGLKSVCIFLLLFMCLRQENILAEQGPRPTVFNFVSDRKDPLDSFEICNNKKRHMS